MAFRSGRFHTYLKPSVRLPRVRPARSLRWSSSTRSRLSEQSTAANEPALMRKTQPEPTAAIRRPAIAGPIIRAALNDVELSPTALERSASSTSSETNVCRAGESKAETQPSRNANTYTCHNCTSPATVRMPSPRASAPMAAWVAKTSFRRSRWSAAKPVNGSNRTCGPNCSDMTTPTAVALWWVSWVRTIQSWAVRCIQVPTFDTSAPPAHIR